MPKRKTRFIESRCGCELPEYMADLSVSGRLGFAGICEPVHLLGGTAEIRSLPGQGTTICVELPA